ncbi:gamma-glutamyltransferase family protein [Nordella sp. HKS 07]|uniref:gamma-glutamyltransferase family protein n=1 Tax=Nordella sp. HKS 07 TaxID=2712222 RepID=UPI0013E1ABEF|nr:gamma-glutamyltransferase family protein [Nordella sp. HKS 07]QIG48182.1 gamma-glutamyltransferase family protein [Nordella sp. HKS 07]
MRNFQLPGRSVAYGTAGMAATSSPLATLLALDIMRNGGNAADAAIAASAVLCITEPHMTGIGGDCFALIGKNDGTIEGINGSGRAGRRADADWLKSARLAGIEPKSVHAVTVPGAIDAWAALLARHGTIDLKEALKPATRLAEEGVPTTPRVAQDWALDADDLAHDEGAKLHYLKDGRAPREGEVMRYPALARTLKLIGERGRDGFYAGEIAEEIVRHLGARGGLLTLDDLAATKASWVAPISTSFAGVELAEIPPNGSGLTALIALNILKQFDMAKYGVSSVERYHLQIEAMKLAWVLRNRHIAEREHMTVAPEDLLSDKTATELAGLIDMKRALKSPENLIPMPGSDTVYLTVVDCHGMAVSFINSIYWAFGSGIVTPKSGIALQNRGANFVTDLKHPNCIGPGKRPLHTIIPAMVRAKGLIDMSFGVMGGSFQPMGHVGVMLNRYVYGLDVQETLDLPRAFPDQGRVEIEAGCDEALRRGLAALGHDVAQAAEPFGGGQAILFDREQGVLAGGSDFRKDGMALGY